MERFHSVLRAMIETGQDIESPENRCRLVYELLGARGATSGGAWLAYTDGIQGWTATDTLVSSSKFLVSYPIYHILLTRISDDFLINIISGA